MRIGVLAVQGAFIEHEKALEDLGAECFEIRQISDLDGRMDGLVLPGGESTVQGKLLKELGMFEILKEKIQNGLPVLATCAGMILLAEKLSDDPTVWFGTLPISVKRNAYGRQLGSFYTEEKYKGSDCEIPMTFIRAPYVESVQDPDMVTAVVEDHIVGVEYKNQIALAFHPELNTAHSVFMHKHFLEKCEGFMR